MNKYIVGVNGVDIEIEAQNVADKDDRLAFYNSIDGRNRNVAVFAPGKWEFYKIEVAA